MDKWEWKAGEPGVRMMPGEKSLDLSSLALKMKGNHQPKTVQPLEARRQRNRFSHRASKKEHSPAHT